MSALEFTILGSGSSGGVPRADGEWGACDPANPNNRRSRCSMLVRRRSADGPEQETQARPQKSLYPRQSRQTRPRQPGQVRAAEAAPVADPRQPQGPVTDHHLGSDEQQRNAQKGR